MKYYTVYFPDTSFPPVKVPEGALLYEYLTAVNSPILFGCRSGLCGVCSMEIEVLEEGALPPPDAKEREALSVYTPDNPKARLGCQIKIQSDLSIRWIKT